MVYVRLDFGPAFAGQLYFSTMRAFGYRHDAAVVPVRALTESSMVYVRLDFGPNGAAHLRFELGACLRRRQVLREVEGHGTAARRLLLGAQRHAIAGADDGASLPTTLRPKPSILRAHSSADGRRSKPTAYSSVACNLELRKDTLSGFDMSRRMPNSCCPRQCTRASLLMNEAGHRFAVAAHAALERGG